MDVQEDLSITKWLFVFSQSHLTDDGTLVLIVEIRIQWTVIISILSEDNQYINFKGNLCKYVYNNLVFL